MDTIDAAPRAWLKDFGHYAIGFVFWGALLSFLQPVTTAQTSFWAVKGLQAVLGVGFGVICAIAFTLLQNGLNQARRKAISWVLAIGRWSTMNLALAFAMGRFG